METQNRPIYRADSLYRLVRISARFCSLWVDYLGSHHKLLYLAGLVDLTRFTFKTTHPSILSIVRQFVPFLAASSSITMCGNTNRPTYGGTIAEIFPRDHLFSLPNSIAASTSSSFPKLSSYSLLFRHSERNSHNTKAIFHIDDAETSEVLRLYGDINIRIE